jgi:hypothetical protein
VGALSSWVVVMAISSGVVIDSRFAYPVGRILGYEPGRILKNNLLPAVTFVRDTGIEGLRRPGVHINKSRSRSVRFRISGDPPTTTRRHDGHERLRGLGRELIRRDGEVRADLDVADVG